MKILFLSDNFPPETNAPATRTYEHAVEWVRAGHEVTVITTAPNFPEGRLFAGYRNAWRIAEIIGAIQVIRVKTYITANEGFLRRSLDYVSFMLMGGLAALFHPRPDVVVTTGSMPLAIFSIWSKLLGARIVWIDSVAQIDRLSLSGRVMRHVADLCLAQWPDVAAHYPNVE